MYPATQAANRPDIVVVHPADDWRSGLVAASLLRPLNAVLLPDGSGLARQIERLAPAGSEALGGARVLAISRARADGVQGPVRRVQATDVAGLLRTVGTPAGRVVVVDADEPGTAVLAAPWAAWSGDLVWPDDWGPPPAPGPRYALGDAEAAGAQRIGDGTPVATAVAFSKYVSPRADDPTFGWGFNGSTLTGYRAWTLAPEGDPTTALQSANLAIRGKPGPLLWTSARTLPAAVDAYLWSQRAAFWRTPSEGPFHHFWVLGNTDAISFPAQGQADYAVEIGPYRQKGIGLAGMDALASIWIVLGLASAAWITAHEVRILRRQHWVMRLAWPLLALMIGPFGIPLYILAHRRPALKAPMPAWDRPLWLQGMAATASSVGFGGALMVATGYVMTLVGMPLVPNDWGPLWLFGTPMILVMVASYVVAVAVSWPLYQAPMIGMLHGLPYRRALLPALPVVLGSMAAVSLAMFPGMWWLMMFDLPMMPSEESILWFGVMFFTVFMGFAVAWPFNSAMVRARRKSGLM